MTDEFENLAYPPAGGRIKLLLLGILLPAVILRIACRAWLTQEAWWPGRQGSGVTVHGESAQAIAIVYLCVAAFVHFRWCWGLLQWDRTFQAGTVCSLLIFLGALIWALCVT